MTNPNQYKISKAKWAEFQEHYAWQLLSTPDYRLGQAFLNYFDTVDKVMNEDGDLGARDSIALYYAINNDEAMELIYRWLDL